MLPWYDTLREPYQFGDGVHSELLHDAATMLLDRLLRGPQLRRDLFVHPAGDDESQHFPLARRQSLHSRSQAGQLGALLSGRAIPLQCLTHCRDEVLFPERLRQKLHCAGLHRADAHRDSTVARDEDDRNWSLLRVQHAHEVQSARVGKLDVEDNAGRILRTGVAQKLRCRRERFTSQANRPDETSQRLPNGKVVVNDVHNRVFGRHQYLKSKEPGRASICGVASYASSIVSGSNTRVRVQDKERKPRDTARAFLPRMWYEETALSGNAERSRRGITSLHAARAHAAKRALRSRERQARRGGTMMRTPLTMLHLDSSDFCITRLGFGAW